MSVWPSNMILACARGREFDSRNTQKNTSFFGFVWVGQASDDTDGLESGMGFAGGCPACVRLEVGYGPATSPDGPD